MKYFSLFSGVGGFECGIEKAYASLQESKRNGNVTSEHSTDRRSEETVSPVGDSSVSEIKSVSVISRPYVETTNGEKNRGSESNQERESEEGKRLLPETWQRTGDEGGRHYERLDILSDEGAPTCVGFSEIDKHASAVLKYRFPNVKNYGDISKIDWSTVPDFDLLVGGSPCQDLSIAGKRAGLDGARSGLFFEYVRALQEKKPSYFIWENVKGALSSNQGRDFAAVLHTLAEEGYSLWWQVLNAKDFGVPQNRERIFVVGTRNGSPREVFLERGDVEETTINTLTPPGTSEAFRVYGTEGVSKTLSANGGGTGAKTGLIVGQPRYDEEGKRSMEYKLSEEAPTIRATQYKSGDNQPRLYVPPRIRRLTPKECERLMSWPDDWTKYGNYDGKVKEVSDSQRYKMCGNGVVSSVISEIVKLHLL